MTFNSEKARYFLCCYQNTTDKSLSLRIVRRSNTINQDISPGEQLLFSASADEIANIYSFQQDKEILEETIVCSQLRYLPSDEG
ncbi:MAG: DUF1830 domain-containing protein [Elainellaceae cyanobacterium]